MRMLGALLLASAALLLAPKADASFHIMSIREVYAGSVANPDSQYVLLQMRHDSENFVQGHSITAYDAAGNPVQTFTFANPVASGANQAFILIATEAAASEFGIAPDLSMSPVLARRGGRVCYDTYDCFAWGNYTGPANRCGGLGSDNRCITGTPFRASEGLASGRAARRDISAGDPNLLEPPFDEASPTGAAGDDTGDSANDFAYTPDPRPTNNAGTTAAAPALGKGFAFANFADVSKLVLSHNGPKAQGGVLRLTPATAAPARSSVWHRQRQPVADGFESSFQFRITPTATTAEGFAFVVHNESNSSLGMGGARLGYQGITNGIAIEFDTRRSGAAEIGVGDPAGKRVSIHTKGPAANSASEAASLDTSASLPTLDDAAVHTARVRYTAGAPGTLAVFVDEVQVAQTRINLAKRLDLTRNAAFVGFTSGSGKGVGNHDILSWSFASTP